MHAFARDNADPHMRHRDTTELGLLVQQASTGDEAAFEELVQTRYAPIRLFLTYMVADDEVGNDLAQETFLKAWQSFPGLREPAAFDSWLYSIARRLALNYLRHERILSWLPWHEWTPTSREEPTERFESNVEERALLKQALATVPPRYRACVILQVIHGLPQRQIAELLGIKKESVSTFVHRGLQLLQQAYVRIEQE